MPRRWAADHAETAQHDIGTSTSGSGTLGAFGRCHESYSVLRPGKALPVVGADRFQLRQVVTNLILNALDAMAGERGTLRLRTEVVRLEGRPDEGYGLGPGSYVKVTVSDTGVGVGAEPASASSSRFSRRRGRGEAWV